MLKYRVIEVFSSEEARWQGKPLFSAIVQQVNDLKIAARTMVTRGIEGSYENGEIATGRLEILSYNMPVRITVILPEADCDRVLSKLGKMVPDGIIAIRDVEVYSHKTLGRLLPRHMRVRDIMTPVPRKVDTTSPLDEVARLLLSSTFSGVPVVDVENRPVGVIAQGDLIYRAGMPLRLGLLAESGAERLGPILESLSTKLAQDVMTRPAVTVGRDRLVTEAVELMLKKRVKRLPVVDDFGKLVGVLSRVDIFRAVVRECRDYTSFQQRNVVVEGLHSVSDIMRRDAHAVLPGTPVEEVMRIIDCNDIQRVCVVDGDGRFLGMISDLDLLSAFSDRHPGIWDFFARKVPFADRGRQHRKLSEHLRAETAAEVMNTDIVTVREDSTIEDAIRLMLERAIKRIPVLDADGKFKGMISRDSLLHTGFDASQYKSKQ
jgi:CBS domain-containing protein